MVLRMGSLCCFNNFMIEGSRSDSMLSQYSAGGSKISLKRMFEAPTCSPWRRCSKSWLNSGRQRKCSGILWEAMRRAMMKNGLAWVNPGYGTMATTTELVAAIGTKSIKKNTTEKLIASYVYGKLLSSHS